MKAFLATGIYDPGRDSDLSISILQTWKVSFDQIRAQNLRAAEVLSLMAVLERQAVFGKLLYKETESPASILWPLSACLKPSRSSKQILEADFLVCIVSYNWRLKDDGWNLWVPSMNGKRWHWFQCTTAHPRIN